MTESERKEARRLLSLQESLKDPAMKVAYEYSQKKAVENESREQILNNWACNNRVYRPPEDEKRIREIIKHFGGKR